MLKNLTLTLFFICTCSFGAAPTTIIDVNKSNFDKWLGKGFVKYPDKLSTKIASEIWDTSAQVINLSWIATIPAGGGMGSCKPIYGSSGFKVKIEGINDKQTVQDNIPAKPAGRVITTDFWVSIEQDTSVTLSSKTQSYECKLSTTNWSTMAQELAAKVVIKITIPPPSCSLSVPPSIEMPLLTTSPSEEKSVEKSLPISVECQVVSGIHYTPNVSLTLSTGTGNSGNHIYDDGKLMLKMLYGDHYADAGKEWLANGSASYQLGQISDGEKITVSPEVEATAEPGTPAQQYSAKAMITMNFS
ncbi:hypothetical protein [Pantoea anthophila]|uniref:hypothetical protein n=1 Tax=Pantoea anthophila TaxID=470931 RepID=UPI00128E2809|nr:hypothetical protein [Pantoea anthophila]